MHQNPTSRYNGYRRSFEKLIAILTVVLLSVLWLLHGEHGYVFPQLRVPSLVPDLLLSEKKTNRDSSHLTFLKFT